MNDKKLKLIPYTIQSIVETTNVTPEGVELIQAPAIWEDSDYGEGIIIAVIDTGIDYESPRFKRANYRRKKFYNGL